MTGSLKKGSCMTRARSQKKWRTIWMPSRTGSEKRLIGCGQLRQIFVGFWTPQTWSDFSKFGSLAGEMSPCPWLFFFRDPWIGWCIETAHLVKGIVACQASPRLVLEFNIVEAQRNSSKQFSKSQAKVHTGFKWHEPSKDAFKLSTGDHNLVYNGIMHFFEKMCLAEVVRFSVKPQFFFRNYLLPK